MRPALPCLAALLLLPSCSGPASGGFAPSGTASAAPPPRRWSGPTPPAVLEGYREFHRVFETALATNDASQVRWVTAEPFASRLTALVDGQRRASAVRRTHLALNPRLAWIKGDTALVLDCVASPGLAVLDAATGRRRGAPPRAERTLVETTLKLRGDWKVWRVGEVRPC